MAQIHELLGKVLAELPAIGKNQRNEQQRFMFRGIDDVMNALNPILAKHGVFYLPEVLERISEERTTKSNSTMYAVHLRVRYTFWAPDGSWVDATGWGEGTDLGDKATSKAMTMAMKYVLFQVFAISTEEASDPDQQTPEPSTKGAAKTPQQASKRGPKPIEEGLQKVQDLSEKASEIAVKRAQRIHIAAKEAGISEEKLRFRIAKISGDDGGSAKSLNDGQAQALLKEIEAFKVKRATEVAAEEGA